MSTNIGNPPHPQPKLDLRLDDARVRPNEPGKDLVANLNQQSQVIRRTHAQAHDEAVDNADNFVGTKPNELTKAPDAVSQKANAMNTALQAERSTGNSFPFRHLPIDKITLGTSQSSQSSKRFLAAANASAVAVKNKPSVSTSVVGALVREAYLGEISAASERLISELNKSKQTKFPLDHPLRISLTQISQTAREEANKESSIKEVKKSLSFVDKFFLENKGSYDNTDTRVIDQYVKGLFSASNGQICSRLAASSELRASLSRAYGIPMINWKTWIAKEKPDAPSSDWKEASLAAASIKAITEYVTIRIIQLEEYASKKTGTAENLVLLSDFRIHEITTGGPGRLLVAELKNNKKISNTNFVKGDCIIVSPPSDSHVSKTSGKFSTTYADVAITELVNYLKQRR